MSSLKERVEKAVGQGNVNLSSADVADFNTQPKKDIPEGPVVTPVPKDIPQDSLITAANKAGTLSIDVPTDLSINGDMETVEITPMERDNFVNALVTGDRYLSMFELFGGKITGSFRSRSQAETQAILVQLTRECRDAIITTDAEYGTRLRSMLLLTQVAQFNGMDYIALKAPLLSRVDGAKITPPGWLGQLEAWETKHEGLIVAIYSELQLFEKKYWTMVRNAKDQNFWNPAVSS